MRVRIIKLRRQGVELERRILAQTHGAEGVLVVQDVTDQGLHRPCKIARLIQAETVRAELMDVSLVWANDGRMTLVGYEQLKNEAGQVVDYRLQSFFHSRLYGSIRLRHSMKRVTSSSNATEL